MNLDHTDKIFDNSLLERFMGELLWEKPLDQVVMRCKGSFIGVGEDGQIGEYVLQGVDDLFEFRHIGKLEVHKHRLLFIGRHINEQWLTTELMKCMRT